MPELVTLTVTSPLTWAGPVAGGAVSAAENSSPEARPIRTADSAGEVSGEIVAFNVDCHPMGPYETVRFAPGCLAPPHQVGRVKLLRDHDAGAPLGVMTSLDANQHGARAAFRLGRHPAAIEAAGLVEDEILDGLSVGIIPIKIRDDNGTTVIVSAALREVSLVAIPAIDSSRASIGAGAPQREEVKAMTAPAPAPPTDPASPTEVPVGGPAPAPDESTLRSLIATEVAAAVAAAAAPAPAPLPEDATTRTGPLAAITATERPGKYPAARGRDGRLYTAGDYFHAYALGAREGDWAKYGVIKAALADELTSDIPGLLPKQIVGELLGQASRRRPVWESFDSRAMPMIGEKFSRPRITQHVKVDPQATQKTQVATQKYKVELDDVGKTTLAGALDIAQQAIDWSSPSLLNELIRDFVSVYVLRTETLAAATLVAAATGTGGGTKVEWDGEAETIVTALATASGNVYSSLGEDQDAFPTTVWLSVDRWVQLAGLTDTTGRPLFPALDPSNATARADLSNPERGLVDGPFRWIVSKRFPEKTFIVGDASMVESYENGRRFLQAVRPDVLGLDLAYMGYAAIYTPYPAALVPIEDAAATIPPSKAKG